MHIGISALKLEVNDEHCSIEMTNANVLSYVKLDNFKLKGVPNEVLSALSAEAVNDQK